MLARANTVTLNLKQESFKAMSVVDLGKEAFYWDSSNAKRKNSSLLTGQSDYKEFDGPTPRTERTEQKEGDIDLADKPVRRKRLSSSTLTFILLATMAVAASLQHSTIQLFIAKMPGNKFYNGILFGLAECLAMLISNVLLLYFDDIYAFRIVFFVGVTSYLLLFYIDEEMSPFLAHLSTVMLIVSIGGWLNINLLIMELRVPPNKVAAVQLMTRTMAVGFGVLAPTLASFEPPVPYILLLIVAILGFFASSMLPNAGHHLP